MLCTGVWSGATVSMIVEVLTVDVRSDVMLDVLAYSVMIDTLAGGVIIVVARAVIALGFAVPISYTEGVLAFGVLDDANVNTLAAVTSDWEFSIPVA